MKAKFKEFNQTFDMDLYIGITAKVKEAYDNVYEGPQFPQKHEVGRFVDFIKIFLQNYVIVNPTDDFDECEHEDAFNLEGRLLECAELRDRVFEDIDAGDGGDPTKFNDDIPLHTVSAMKKYLMEKLM